MRHEDHVRWDYPLLSRISEASGLSMDSLQRKIKQLAEKLDIDLRRYNGHGTNIERT